MDMNGITLEDVIAERNRRAQSKQVQPTIQTPAQPAAPQSQGLILDLVNKIDKSGALANTLGRTATGFMGKDAPQNEYQKLYNQEAIKKQFEDPTEKAMNMKLKESLLNNRIEQPNQRDDREQRMRDFEGRRQASTLRGELNQNSYVKNFQTMNSAATGIDSILQDTISRPDLKSKNVGDQALITLYNKIIDPMSVVRESEYARTPEGQSLLNRIQGFSEKVASGGSGLTDTDRIEVARAAKVLINNSGELYNNKISDYDNLAEGYGADKNLVTGGYQRFSPYDINKQYGNPTPVANNQPGQVTPSVLTPEQQAKRARLQQKYGV